MTLEELFERGMQDGCAAYRVGVSRTMEGKVQIYIHREGQEDEIADFLVQGNELVPFDDAFDDAEG
ncbi:hypothetical protein SAMN05216577_12826 [Pseudomonas citronellolis]|uniref:Uncharacterized protein n=1 Tax=Pseudomonas citronellolis TaxID=53408 RepID=A0AAQ1KJ09_9PSED|nr:hypothetical protein [Pseudomonas citronellolis]TGC32417.1 hypothetical protein CW310_01985 [Pseudomonas citronellolis]SFD52178.1 hypothetical protein SAMN05216577_12826 [Pseudomonas citronellolis]